MGTSAKRRCGVEHVIVAYAVEDDGSAERDASVLEAEVIAVLPALGVGMKRPRGRPPANTVFDACSGRYVRRDAFLERASVTAGRSPDAHEPGSDHGVVVS